MRSRIAVLPLLAFLAIAAPAAADDSVRPGQISLVGQGQVSAAPDMARVTSGVVTQAKTARDALDANTAAMTQLVDVLKQADIAEKDIQTSGFSVQPQYVYSDKRDENGYTPPPRIVGYQVTNSVTVVVRKLDDLGAVLDKAVTVGANSISGISFDVSDTSAILDEARKQAVADALAKARLYTGAAGIGLGRIVSISETGAPQPQPEMFKTVRAMAADSAPVPVQAGELTYGATVSVTWELDQ